MVELILHFVRYSLFFDELEILLWTGDELLLGELSLRLLVVGVLFMFEAVVRLDIWDAVVGLSAYEDLIKVLNFSNVQE